MDTNRFKSSHDFSNIQKNLHNNPRYSVESNSQQLKEYIHEMASEAREKNKHYSDEKK